MNSLLSIDYVIIYGFLLLTLYVGIRYGGKNTSVREFALANKEYGVPVVLLTLMATLLGAGAVIGNVAEVYTNGFVYFFSLMGAVLSYVLIAFFLAPKFEGKFPTSNSVADMMTDMFNSKIGKVAAFFAFFHCVGVLCAQFTGMGNIFASFLSIDYSTAVWLSAGTIIIYSTIGGVRSVAFTDILQFIMLIITIPLIASIVTNLNGGVVEIFRSAPAEKKMIFSHPEFLKYLALFFFWLLPFQSLSAPTLQRYLMAEHVRKLRWINLVFAAVDLFVFVMVLFIGFAAIKMSDSFEPKQIISVMIMNYLPVVLKGVAISGIFAVIMSTADSFLNSAAILAVQFFVPKEKQTVMQMRVATLVIGLLGCVAALKNLNIVRVVLTASLFNAVSICIPLFFAILGFKLRSRDYIFSLVVSMTFAGVAYGLKIDEFYVPLLVSIVSIITLMSSYALGRRALRLQSEKDMKSSLVN